MSEKALEEAIVKKLSEIKTEKGSCGIRKKLITNEDSQVLALSHLEISDAKRHYHKNTTEVYYVLSGLGELELDDKKIKLEEGTTVLVKPGMVHRAISHEKLNVLIAMSPSTGETDDIFYV